jgi:hypothetical protein
MTTTVSGPDPLKALRAAFAKKCVANSVHLSTDAQRDSEFFTHMTERLAETIADGLRKFGLRATDDEPHIAVIGPNPADPFGQQATIAAKLYAVWSERPIDLLIFCVQAMEDARAETKMQERFAAEYRHKYITLLEHLAVANSMDEVREFVREMSNQE